MAQQEPSLLWQRIQHQQDVRDRWFRYSLVLLGIPLSIAAAFEKAEFTNPFLVGSAAFLFASIGLCFLLVYIFQRINSAELMSRLEPPLSIKPNDATESEAGDVNAHSNVTKSDSGFWNCLFLRAQYWGADFFANCAQSLMNSGLFALGSYYVGLKSPQYLFAMLLLLVYLQLFVRQAILLSRSLR